MTQTVTDMVNSFNGGELSSRMEGRTDTAIYKVAAKTVENFLLTVEGPIVKAPGFEYIRAAAAGVQWVSRFVFSSTQAYLLEWGNGKLRFYTNGGRIEADPATPYEVVVPFAAAEAPMVSRQQSYDRQYMAHRSHPPGALIRTGGSTFSYADLALVNGPFEDQNSDKTITITASGDLTLDGVVTLTCTSAIFAAGDVGGLFRLECYDFSTIPAWQSGISLEPGEILRSDGKVYQEVDGGTGRTGNVPPTHDEGVEWDGKSSGTDVNDNGPYGQQWRYLYDRFGIVRITAVAGDGLSCTATVLRRLPDSLSTVASWRWAFGAFSTRRGWPNVVLKSNERLIFFKDFDIYGSVVGDYLNHATFTSSGQVAADMAFRYRLASSDPVLWASDAGKYIIVGTATGEYPIGAVNTAAAFGPGNVGVVGRPSNYGCAAVWPLAIGTLLNFVQHGLRRLREAQYDFQRDAIVANDTTIWCRHMTKSGLAQLCYMAQPEALLFATRGDGQLVAHAQSAEQQVKGWSRRIHAAGAIVSADVLPTMDGTEDELWALVRDGAGNLSIEQMQPFFDEDETDQADQFFVDSGATVTLSPPATHVTGATWLGGKAVAVLADGAVVPGITVAADGSFDLPYAASKVTVGLPYTARLVSLRMDVATRDGTAQGKLKKLVNAILRVIKTGTGLFAGTAGGTLDEIIMRSGSDRMDEPIPLLDGDTDQVSIGGGFDRDGRFELVHSDPTNCIVAAVMPRYEVSDR